ncbi:hypothetical protein SNEBB_002259 [Seison nebaliae]|nr:hypothetical protein SNEBB_002259 [Seison nebaliae]
MKLSLIIFFFLFYSSINCDRVKKCLKTINLSTNDTELSLFDDIHRNCLIDIKATHKTSIFIQILKIDHEQQNNSTKFRKENLFTVRTMDHHLNRFVDLYRGTINSKERSIFHLESQNFVRINLKKNIEYIRQFVEFIIRISINDHIDYDKSTNKLHGNNEIDITKAFHQSLMTPLFFWDGKHGFSNHYPSSAVTLDNDGFTISAFEYDGKESSTHYKFINILLKFVEYQPYFHRMMVDFQTFSSWNESEEQALNSIEDAFRLRLPLQWCLSDILDGNEYSLITIPCMVNHTLITLKKFHYETISSILLNHQSTNKIFIRRVLPSSKYDDDLNKIWNKGFFNFSQMQIKLFTTSKKMENSIHIDREEESKRILVDELEVNWLGIDGEFGETKVLQPISSTELPKIIRKKTIILSVIEYEFLIKNFFYNSMYINQLTLWNKQVNYSIENIVNQKFLPMKDDYFLLTIEYSERIDKWFYLPINISIHSTNISEIIRFDVFNLPKCQNYFRENEIVSFPFDIPNSIVDYMKLKECSLDLEKREPFLLLNITLTEMAMNEKEKQMKIFKNGTEIFNLDKYLKIIGEDKYYGKLLELSEYDSFTLTLSGIYLFKKSINIHLKYINRKELRHCNVSNLVYDEQKIIYVKEGEINEVHSPLFPHNYLPDLQCKWMIIANSSNKLIQHSVQSQFIINFSQLHLGSQSPKVLRNRRELQVSDGCNRSDTFTIGEYDVDMMTELNNIKFCYNQKLNSIITTDGEVIDMNQPFMLISPAVRINFISDSFHQSTGFQVRYSANINKCTETNGGCQQRCHMNEKNEHKCSCFDGYELHQEKYCYLKNCRFQNVMFQRLQQYFTYPNKHFNVLQSKSLHEMRDLLEKNGKYVAESCLSIKTRPGHRIHLQFFTMSTVNCSRNNLIIFDGSSGNLKNITGELCGLESYPMIVDSLSNVLVLRWKEEFEKRHMLRKNLYKLVKRSQFNFRLKWSTLCGSNHLRSNINRIRRIYSHPYFGLKNYGKQSSNCQWIITAENEKLANNQIKLLSPYAQCVKIFVVRYHLEKEYYKDKNECFDSLQIYDLDENENKKLITKLCGNHSNETLTFVSKGRKILISFSTDSIASSDGFKLYYTSTKCRNGSK